MLIGQEIIKKQIDLIIEAKNTKPILICGPSGYGKTSFAKYIAEASNRDLVVINCATKINKIDLLRDIIRAPRYACILLDEVHALPKQYQEIIYSFLDKQKIIYKGVNLDISTAHFIGATTDEGSLLEPFLNRFTYKLLLGKYTEEDLANIIFQYLGNIKWLDAIALAKASRGCPRVAINRANSFKISKDIQNFFKIWNISEDGFEAADLEYLQLLERHAPKPVSLKTIEQKLKMSQDTIINNIESFLIYKDLITKNSKGRELSDIGNDLLRRIKSSCIA